MPVRGEVCQKIWLGFKVAAANFKKLLKGLKPATHNSGRSFSHYIILFLLMNLLLTTLNIF
jgi:hypothetical protein